MATVEGAGAVAGSEGLRAACNAVARSGGRGPGDSDSLCSEGSEVLMYSAVKIGKYGWGYRDAKSPDMICCNCDTVGMLPQP